MVFLSRVLRNTPNIFKAFLYNNATFNKFGLMEHDCLHDTPVVDEAVRRMPQHLQDERVFRIIRANQLEIRNEYMPKEEWTTIETDTQYMKPYLDRVLMEIAEREEWEKNN